MAKTVKAGRQAWAWSNVHAMGRFWLKEYQDEVSKLPDTLVESTKDMIRSDIKKINKFDVGHGGKLMVGVADQRGVET